MALQLFCYTVTERVTVTVTVSEQQLSCWPQALLNHAERLKLFGCRRCHSLRDRRDDSEILLYY